MPSALVIVGTGDHFDITDNLLAMDSYRYIDATEKPGDCSKFEKVIYIAAHGIAEQYLLTIKGELECQ